MNEINTTFYFQHILNNQKKFINIIINLFSNSELPDLNISNLLELTSIQIDKILFEYLYDNMNSINKIKEKHSELNDYYMSVGSKKFNTLLHFDYKHKNYSKLTNITLNRISFKINYKVLNNKYILSLEPCSLEILKFNDSTGLVKWQLDSETIVLFIENKDDFEAIIQFHWGEFYDFNFSDETMCLEKDYKYIKSFRSLMYYSFLDIDSTILYLLKNENFSLDTIENILLVNEIYLDNNLIDNLLFNVYDFKSL